MLLCDRCKDINKIYVITNSIYYEQNTGTKNKNDGIKLGDIDLCQLCANILYDNIKLAIYATRSNKKLKVGD